MICPFFEEPLFFFYVADLPGLLYYSYVPAIVVALLAGVVVILNDRKSLLNQLFFTVCALFLMWTLGTLVAWTNIHGDVLLFAWSFLGPVAGLLSIYSVYFTYVFLEKKDVGLKTKGVFVALLAPLLILAPSSYTLSGLNLVDCDAFGFEGIMNTAYFPALGALAIVWIFALLIRSYRKAGVGFKKQIVIMGTGIELFLFSFFTTEFLGQYLTTSGFLPDSQLELYGYFGMIVFVVYISILIVRFKTFHVSLIASQVLVVALIILIGSQFTFIRNTTNLILTAITLVLTGAVGIVLIRSVKKEIELRKHVQSLAQDLEKANQQQVLLIHFITHQVKGFLTKSRNIFATALEGDCGPVPDSMRPFFEEGLRSDTKGVATVQEILNAANIKSGKVTYAKEPFDLKALVDEVAKDHQAIVNAKKLSLIVDTGTEPLMFTGDRLQMQNAIKNLVDNSIKYTPAGVITLQLTKDEKGIHFVIHDTGVGITAEDMAHLFTEGGHGKESQKINVESTGFGLYIVKNIIDAHGGTVHAESEGHGKGARFVVELPA